MSAAPIGMIPPPAARTSIGPTGFVGDPLFFAEEFAARRRRYIPVDVNIAGISRREEYKNYNFPFITGEAMSGTGTHYPLLFQEARDVRFRSPAAAYIPTTRFEAMTYEVYKKEAESRPPVPPATEGKKSNLERLRNLFVDSLLNEGLLVDMQLLRSSPTPPPTGQPFGTPAPAAGAAVGPPPGSFTSRDWFESKRETALPGDAQSINLFFLNLAEEVIAKLLNSAPPGDLLDLGMVWDAIDRTQIILKKWSDEAKSSGAENWRLYRDYAFRLEQDLKRFVLQVRKINVNTEIIDLADSLLEDVEKYKSSAGRVMSYIDAINDRRAAYAPNSPIANLALRGITLNDFNLSPDKLYVKDVGQSHIVDPLPIEIKNLIAELGDILAYIKASITHPRGAVQPQQLRGYLTPEFFSYLRRISVTPLNVASPELKPCEMILFKDFNSENIRDNPIIVDMTLFTRSLTPNTFGQPLNPEFISRQNMGNEEHMYVSTENLGCGPDPKTAGLDEKKLAVIQRSQTDIPTIEDAYNKLKIVLGKTPLERYLEFIRFIYLFFDHIPEVQPVVSALLVPLVGMYAGIIKRGSYVNRDRNAPLLLMNSYSDSEILKNSITYYLAQDAIFNVTSRKDSAHAVIKMYKYHRRAYNAIISLMGFPSNDPAELVQEAGYIPPLTTSDQDILIKLLRIEVADGDQNLAGAKRIYADCGIVEFNLPSIGSAHMILPRVLGVPETNVLSMIYELCTKWFETEQDYEALLDRIHTKVLEYNNYSNARIAYTLDGLNGIITIPSGKTPYVLINGKSSVRGASPEYITLPLSPRPPLDLKDHYSYTLPHSWGELLYPAYVTHAIVGLVLLRELDDTMVRPCLQGNGYSISFPSGIELTGAYVAVEGGIDLEAQPEIFSAVFEFPADIYNVELPTGNTIGTLATEALGFYPGDPEPTVTASRGSTSYNIMRRGSVRTRNRTHGAVGYRLVDSTNLTASIPAIAAWSTRRLPMSSNPYLHVPLLKDRTRYAWTELPDFFGKDTGIMTFSAPVSGEPIFLSPLFLNLFLSSFFDWKLQLYFLLRLHRFMEGRTSMQMDLDRIIKIFDQLKKEAITSAQDEQTADIYMKENILPLGTENGAVAYSGFRNVIFNIVGPLSSANLSEILKLPSLIGSFDLTKDIKQFYKIIEITPPRGPLNYNIDLDAYLNLLAARSGVVVAFSEQPDEARLRNRREQEAQYETDIARLTAKSAVRLADPYSILINEVTTRAAWTGT